MVEPCCFGLVAEVICLAAFGWWLAGKMLHLPGHR